MKILNEEKAAMILGLLGLMLIVVGIMSKNIIIWLGLFIFGIAIGQLVAYGEIKIKGGKLA